MRSLLNLRFTKTSMAVRETLPGPLVSAMAELELPPRVALVNEGLLRVSLDVEASAWRRK